MSKKEKDVSKYKAGYCLVHGYIPKKRGGIRAMLDTPEATVFVLALWPVLCVVVFLCAGQFVKLFF